MEFTSLSTKKFGDKKSKSSNVNSIRASFEPYNKCSIDKVFHGKESGVRVKAASLFMNRRT